MAELEIAEAIRLISSRSQIEIESAFLEAFASPSPDLSPEDIASLTSWWNSPEAQFQRLLRGDLTHLGPPEPGIQYFEHRHTYPDGTQGNIGIPYRKLLQPRAQAYASPKADRKKLATALSALIEATAKCGIPRSPADKLANEAKIEAAIKGALTRYAVKTAMVNGAWQSAALTAVFDFRHIVDGEFKKYLINIGISGLYGGTIGGLSSWINHPFFSNGLVLGVIVGSAFNTVNLVSTGDWARFGKSLGINVVGGTTAWGLGSAGFYIGGRCGPLGAAVGGIVGGIFGGLAGRWGAVEWLGLGGRTEHEVKTMFKAIKEQLNTAGLEPDPSLSPNEVIDRMIGTNGGSSESFPVRITGSMASSVTELRDVLLDMRKASPRVFATFLESLRAADSSL
ncbi:hypothetical protein SLS60_006404 [Paraconiothyrium brasiliense]|uniref:Uncharacterized protein n=1 Tax=Paraconiothyrium brasiliense TaxID=300254 RepID=A0ABR3RAM1_9PLEO